MNALNKMIIATATIGVLGIGGVAKAIPLSQSHRATTYQVSQVSDRQTTRSEETPDTTSDRQTTRSGETPDATSDRESEVNDDKIPVALKQVGEYGEATYDFAKASDWTKVKANLSSLQNAAKNLHKDTNSKQTIQLNKRIATLSQAVDMKNRLAAMHDANQVTLIAANITTEFQGKVPVEITLLDYYGRELEIWTAQGNTTKLKATANDIQRTWEKVRPAIEVRKGTTQARNFDYLVKRVVAAKVVTDYNRLSTPILNEVDNLEKVFQ